MSLVDFVAVLDHLADVVLGCLISIYTFGYVFKIARFFWMF